MRSVGFTLIELLIVLSIISILTIVGVVNFKDYAQDQVTIKATGQIQSLLRTAQRNSSSSVKCTDTEPAVSWLVDFKDATSDSNHRTITLSCKSPTSSEDSLTTIDIPPSIELNVDPIAEKKLWYYLNTDSQSIGPMSFQAFYRSWKEGKISKEMYIWNETLTDWVQFKEIFSV